MKRMTLALALIAGLTPIGCLRKDVISTIYLRQDGSLDWVVSERNVRSDEADATKRAKEESGYLDAVALDDHDVAQSFRVLGGADIRARVQRESRPYEVTTDARFRSLGDLARLVLTVCGVPHRVDLTTDNGVTTWRMWADPGKDGENVTEGDSDECARAFGGLADWDSFSIRLESGQFTNAVGFKIENSDTAIIDEAATRAQEKGSGQLVLSLSWTSRSPA